MPFTSAKRASGQAGTSGQTTTQRVNQAGRGASSKRSRTRGSGQLRVAQPQVTFGTVLATSFDALIIYNNPAARPSSYFLIVTENAKIPTPQQIVDGFDAAGDAAVTKAEAVVDAAEPPQVAPLAGLITATLYHVFTIVQDDLRRFSTISSESQLTA